MPSVSQNMSSIMHWPNDQTLNDDIKRQLKDLTMEKELSKESKHFNMLKDGLELLSGVLDPADQTWKDAILYARAVIVSPKDDPARANALWTRSCSEMNRSLLNKFGPTTVKAACDGCSAIIVDHFDGNRSQIAHIDKKANFMRCWRNQIRGEAFYPQSSALAGATYETGTFACALTLLAWSTAEKASRLASIAHLAICDDYHRFTGHEYEVRIRMVALAMGAAYEHGGWSANAIIDGSLLQASGTNTSTDPSVDSIMAWRAVSGCTAPYSGYLLGIGNVKEGLVAPLVMMAVHDLFDWRSDAAAGNHENGVSALYGLGIKTPFYTYLEALLRTAAVDPTAAMHAIASLTVMHFTGTRYGSYNYRGLHDPGCANLTELLRQITASAQFKWSPEPPPRSFEEGAQIRELGKLLVDQHEDHGIVQVGISWFQHLIITGEIWLFDLLAAGVDALDANSGWE